MNLTSVDTHGYAIIRNFIDIGEIDRLVSHYRKSIAQQGSNKNYRVVSSVEHHGLESKIYPILSEIRDNTPLTVDMCYRGSMYFRSGDIDFKWHQDHETYYLTQQAYNSLNFWIPLIKPFSFTTGLTIISYNDLGSYRNHFLGHGAQNITILDKDRILIENCETGENTELQCDIESLSHSPEIMAGDALVMRGDMLHRTQDTDTDRLAMSIRCFDSNSVVDKEKFYSGCQHKRTMIENNKRLYSGLIERFNTQDRIKVGDILPHN